MDNEQRDVYNFMVKAGQETPDRPTVPADKVRLLRVRLIAQELLELARAYGVHLVMDTNQPEEDILVEISTLHPLNPDPVAVLTEALDATVDLQVVTIGNGIAAGLDLEPGWNAVHKSNMEKFDGGYRDAFGKWKKPANWRPPNLRVIIEDQLTVAQARDLEPALSLDGS